MRDAALRRLDANVRDGTMQPRGAEVIERLIAVGQRADRAWVAKWPRLPVIRIYLTAFQKKIADPEGARDRFSQQEIEAVRRVNEVEELRAMSTVDTLGGYLIPAQLDPTILLSSSGSQNAIREMARVEQTVGETWRGVSSTGPTVRWVAEASEETTTACPWRSRKCLSTGVIASCPTASRSRATVRGSWPRSGVSCSTRSSTKRTMVTPWAPVSECQPAS